MDFNEALVYHTGTGPYYDWDWKWGASSSCSNAPFSSYHFRFAKPTVCLMERDSYDIRPLNELSPLNQNMLLWFDIYAVFPWTDPTAFFSFFASRNNYSTIAQSVSDETQLYEQAERR